MFYVSPVGEYRTIRIGVAGEEIIQITALGENEEQFEIVAHVSQCSVRFTVFEPRTDAERAERPFIGFTVSQEKTQ